MLPPKQLFAAGASIDPQTPAQFRTYLVLVQGLGSGGVFSLRNADRFRIPCFYLRTDKSAWVPVWYSVRARLRSWFTRPDQTRPVRNTRYTMSRTIVLELDLIVHDS